ncbi:MAG: hypothetical protein QM734_06735 [Cyclobacteriaceae bacterium]
MKKFLFFLIIMAYSSCTYNSVEPTPPPVLYFSTVRTIIHDNCMHCHSETGPWYGRPIAFDKDSGIVANSGLIKYEVENKFMPKGGSLSQGAIDTIVIWYNAGGTINN